MRRSPWTGRCEVRLVGTLIALQGLPSKLLTHKPRLTTSPLETGSSTLDSTGQFRCRQLAKSLVGPLDAHIFSSISTSGPVPGALHLPSSSSHSPKRGYPGYRRGSCASLLSCIIGLHWPSSRRVKAVFISIPSGPSTHLVYQFWTSYIYQHPTRILPLSFRPIRTRTLSQTTRLFHLI